MKIFFGWCRYVRLSVLMMIFAMFAVIQNPAFADTPPIGWQASSSCTEVKGWSCDASNYSAAVKVEVYKDGPKGQGTLIGTATTSTSDSTANQYCKGRARSKFGFTLSLSTAVRSSLQDGNPHTFYAYALNYPTPGALNTLLEGAPHMLSCSNGTNLPAHIYWLQILKTGNGTVKSILPTTHLDCGSACSFTYWNNTQVTLEAVPDPGWAFDSWSLGCSGKGSMCTVTMNAAKSVKAIFKPAPNSQVLYQMPSRTDPSDIKKHVMNYVHGTGQALPADGDTFLIAWGQKSVMTNPVSWNVGSYTGFTPPSPVANYQYGVKSTTSKTTALQWYGNTVGIVNVPSSVERQGELVPITMGYTFLPSSDVRPWDKSTAELVVSFNLKVPTASIAAGQNVAAYVQPAMIFWDVSDPAKPKAIWYVLQAYDNRSTISKEFVQVDQCSSGCTGLPIVASSFSPGTVYGHMGPGSAQLGSSTFGAMKYYEYRISRAEFIKAIKAIKAKNLDPKYANLSEDPSKYKITLISVLSEVYFPSGSSSVVLGCSFQDFKAVKVW